MYVMFDMKNGIECIAALPMKCECCEYRLDSTCNDKECPEYSACLTGEKVIYKGNIGSSLMALLSLDVDLLKKRVPSICSKSTKKSANVDFDNWEEQFDMQWLKLTAPGEMFIRIILYRYYTINRERYMKEYLHEKDDWLIYIKKHINKEFNMFECVRNYVDKCVIDNKLYDPMIFKFASEYLLKSDQEELRPLKAIELVFGNVYFNIRRPLFTPNEFLETLQSEYEERKSSINPVFVGYDEIYEVRNINMFAVVSLEKILESELRFKVCENCGMPFIPYNRTDTKYCDRPALQDRSKTCKEFGARNTWQKTLKEDESAGLYRRIYMSKQMLARRHNDIPKYEESFKLFVSEAKIWKTDVRKGKKTPEEFITWLKIAKEKKVM